MSSHGALPIRLPSLALVAAAWLCAGVLAHGQPAAGDITGQVTDGLQGALPGVTVTLEGERVPEPLVAVTDGTGRYSFDGLPSGVYSLTFEMSGFDTRVRADLTLPSGGTLVVDQPLGLAPLTETVMVFGEVPARPPVSVEPPPPRPRYTVQPLPPDTLASVCEPAPQRTTPMALGRVLGHRNDPSRRLYGQGDELVLDVGTRHGAVAGQRFVVRRSRSLGTGIAGRVEAMGAEQTAGLIQVVEIQEAVSLALVVYACGELVAGDRLEPFLPQRVAAPLAAGTPAFDDPARVLFGDDGRLMAAPPQLMVIDRGTSGGVQRGQRLTIFRPAKDGRGGADVIAEAVVVTLHEAAATIRLERAKDAVMAGDYAALHR